MRRIIQSSETKAALREIHSYTADHWGTAQARKYHGQFKTAFKNLAENPALGHRYPDVPEYHTYPVGSHTIVYHANTRELHVIAVFHQSMDIESRIHILQQRYRSH